MKRQREKIQIRKKLSDPAVKRVAVIFAGIVMNIVPAAICSSLGLMLFMDTIGTTFCAAVAGSFPGILVAVVTNLICSAFNENAMYFAVINSLIAMYSAYVFRKGTTVGAGRIAGFILKTSLMAGIVGTLVQYSLIGGIRHPVVSDMVDGLIAATGCSFMAAFLFVYIILNVIDKAVATGLALVFIRLVPDEMRRQIRDVGWRQRPLSDSEMKELRKWGGDIRHSIRSRIFMTLLGSSLALVVVMAVISMKLTFDNAKAEKTEIAMRAAQFGARILDPERITDYIIDGRKAEGYEETEQMLYYIRSTAQAVKYLYVLRIEDRGCRFIFDLEDEEAGDAYSPGELVPFEEDFMEFIPALKAGEEIEPVISNGAWNWMLTVYYPVRNEAGKCVCYVGADVSLDYMAEYMQNYMIRVLLISAGFFVLILAFGLWTTGVYTVLPVNSMASCMDGFMESGADQEMLDENVKRIKALDIHTGDEVEKLYKALCRLSSETTEQMRDIRRYAEATANMQNGLIITMADMVENRDSDTGAHIQKTAAYVKIILNGLRDKGYYVEKLTPKYISDVVMSAPLHDVGKINIPDAVLNKPGKLTPEEFEIMKTHTLAGKKIMENAISTVQGENYLKEARNMAAYHHERWDGKGYPEGLKGEVIPLSARVMAVADVFDALTSPRIYKPAFPLEKALGILEEGAGAQFDPRCIEVFMEHLSEVKMILKKYNV